MIIRKEDASLALLNYSRDKGMLPAGLGAAADDDEPKLPLHSPTKYVEIDEDSDEEFF